VSAARSALACLTAFLVTGAVLAAARPHLNSGACLSCHAQQLATLPDQPCVSCHLGNMDFLARHDVAGHAGSLWVMGAAGFGSVSLLLLLGLSGVRRLAPAMGVLALAVLASPGADPPLPAPSPGAILAARGWACDLSPKVSPDGNAVLFARRGPDTSGDGRVDMRDGLALFLLRRDWISPKRLTPYGLDAQAAMAVWAPDGNTFAVPVPGGLAAFDPAGRALSRMASLGGEIHSPAFSPDGARVAFVEGSGIGVWDPATGQRSWALDPAKDGTFPRLSGWSPWDEGPLFTPGSDYTRLERDGEGRLMLSEEVPLEIATAGKARPLTPRGPEPLRRFKAQPVSGGIFYLAQHPGGLPGLYLFDGNAERLWSGERESVLGFEALSTGDCWAWVSASKGNVRLVRYSGPGQGQTVGPGLKASLLALTVQGCGEAWFSGVPPEDSRRRLFRAGPTIGDMVACDRDIWRISAEGGTLAQVAAQQDPDEKGVHPSWGRGELWVSWRAP